MTLFLLSVLVIPWKFCILYGSKNKHFRKTRCIVDRGMFSRDSACLILRRGLFSNNDRTFLISPSLIRGLPLPLCAIFPAVKNRASFDVFRNDMCFSESGNAILRIFSKLDILIRRFLERTKYYTND